MNKSVCSGTAFKWEFYCCVHTCTQYTQTVSVRHVTHMHIVLSPRSFIQLNTDSLTLVNAEPITLNEKKYFVIIYFLTLNTKRRRRRHCHCPRPTNDEQSRNSSAHQLDMVTRHFATFCHLFLFISFIRSVASAVRLWFYIVNFVINKARGFIVASSLAVHCFCCQLKEMQITHCVFPSFRLLFRSLYMYLRTCECANTQTTSSVSRQSLCLSTVLIMPKWLLQPKIFHY